LPILEYHHPKQAGMGLGSFTPYFTGRYGQGSDSNPTQYLCSPLRPLYVVFLHQPGNFHHQHNLVTILPPPSFPEEIGSQSILTLTMGDYPLLLSLIEAIGDPVSDIVASAEQ